MVTKTRLLDKVRPYAKRMHGVGEEHRMAIVYILAHDPKEVWEIVDALGIAENLVSHHLRQLYLTGWVLRTKQGRRITYRLNEKAFFEFNKLFTDTPFDRQVLSKYSK